VQADRLDLGPAFTYLIFDASDNRQSARKENAFNYAQGQGLPASALEVVLGGFPFTAVGHQTRTRWTTLDGIPAVEAIWWAGGVRVRELLLALGDGGVFLRRVELTPANLGGPEDIVVRLALPPGPCAASKGWLVRDSATCRVGLGLGSNATSRAVPEQGRIEIGPLQVSPGSTSTVDTVLLAQIPPGLVESESALLQKTAPERDALGVLAVSELRARTRQVWNATSSVRTGDATVQEIFDKARFGLSAMVADNGVMDAGIFEYGAQWVRDTSNTLLGLVHAGHFELARNGFAYVLEHMVTPEGNAMIGGVFDNPDREQFDQMGELMHALKAYRDWTGDD
jgi:hypothetical protein